MAFFRYGCSTNETQSELAANLHIYDVKDHVYEVSDMRKCASICEYELIHIIRLEGLANGTHLD
jgi:hypothetical protein